MERQSTISQSAPFHCAGTENRPEVELVAVEPDCFRDAVCAALSSLPEDQRSSVINGLLIEFRNAGLRVCESLLMLGASASTTDELTAPEIAALIRYVRLTKPHLMMAVAEPLRELLGLTHGGFRVTGKAA